MNPLPGAALLQRPAPVDSGRGLLAGLADILPLGAHIPYGAGVSLSLLMPHRVMPKSS